MIDPVKIGYSVAKTLISELTDREEGPCFYPGKFKPPHVGHFEVVKNLRSLSYIQKITVLISNKVVDGITPEDSLAIWNMYLKAQPIPNVLVQISDYESPIQDIIEEVSQREQGPVYVVVGSDEEDDTDYGNSLKEKYKHIVQTIQAEEKKGIISAPYVRGLLASGDYEGFKEAIPTAAFNKGYAKTIYNNLTSKIELPDGSEEA